MKKILILIFLLVPSLATASQKVFYDSVSDLQIVDVSGQKTKGKIVEEFNLENTDFVQELTIDETQEAVRINGYDEIVKYNYVIENEEKKGEEREIREYKESLIKNKLKLTDSDWADLKQALGLEIVGTE